MTFAYHHNKLINPVERLVLSSAYTLLSGLSSLMRLPVLVAWVVGLFVLITIGLIYTLVFYIPILIARKKVKNTVQAIINDPSSIDQRDAMELMASMESTRFKIDQSLITGRNFFVFLPITNEMKKLSDQFAKAEAALAKIAYPANEALTRDQQEYLKEKFKGWREDWVDSSMDVYN